MLIDNHTHAFWPDDLKVLRERLTMLDAALDQDSPHKWQLYGNGQVDGLLELQKAAGVERTVLLPMTGRRDRCAELNRWAAKVQDEEQAIISFGVLHPLGPVEQDLALIVELGLKGVKLHPFVQRFSLDHPDIDGVFGRLERAGLPVLLDTMHMQGLINSKPHLDGLLQQLGFCGVEPAQIARLATAHPKLNIIAAHGGSLYGWDHLAPLWELDNVYFDLAYLNGLLTTQETVDLIRRKGPQRMIYGSDAPWRRPDHFRAWFEELPLTSGERQQVGSGTISALLNL